MSKLMEGQKVIYHKFKDEMYWCELVVVDGNTAHLRNLKRPEDKLMKTKVLSKIQRIPMELLT